MDIDVMGRHIRDLLTFKTEVEGMIAKAKASGAPSVSVEDIEKVLSFLPEFDKALTDFGKLADDIKSVSEHVAEIRQDLAPVIEWVEAKQRAEANAAATTEAEKDATPKEADEAAKPAGETRKEEPVDLQAG